MKRLSLFLCLLTAFAAVPPVLSPPPPVSAQSPKPDDRPLRKKYHRGRKAPKNLAALKKLKRLRHGDFISRLPRATAATYDCRALGLVPPVKDQGQCGSCWDFSGTTGVESALIKAGVLKNDGSGALSEQYTLDCGQNGGCNGDDNTTVLQWAKTTGLPLTSDYGQYHASSGSCKYKTAMKLYKIADWGFVDNSGGNGVTDTQLIKNAMVQYGPIPCAVAAGSDWDGATAETIISGHSTNIDHDVELVGWDDTKGKSGVWIVRNSWGPDWANHGYVYMEYGADSIGTEAVWAVAAGSPVPPGPVPPDPVPPGPVPPGPSGTVTLTLTPDQVKSVISQSGAVVVTKETTIGDLLAIFQKFQDEKEKAKKQRITVPMEMPKKEVRLSVGEAVGRYYARSPN